MPLAPAPNLTPFVVSNTTEHERSASQVRLSGATAPASATTVANTILAYPVTIFTNCTAYKLFFWNGTSVGSNHEVGIFDDKFNKIISTGSQGAGSASLPSVVDVTDTPLSPGRYYVGHACSTATANRVMAWSPGSGASVWRMLGCWQASGAPGSWASTVTPAAYAAAYQPLCGFITRSNYDL